MLFNSYIFIFIFLPIAIIGWYGLNKLYHPSFAFAFLTGMSLWFYGYFNPSYMLIIISSILVNYFISFLMDKAEKGIQRKILFYTGLVFNLGLLFVFKYYDFFIENINAVFKTGFALKYIVLPLGISFFTFQQLSFIIDRYKGKAKHYSFLKYSTFVTFFPQLVAGPIVLYDEIMPQFEDVSNRIFNHENFVKGFWLFVVGLSKKVLLADVLAIVVNYGYDNVGLLDSPSALFVAILYAFELYFDFSGYSDMAMGLGRMFNIIIPQNFNSPYKASSMKELWQRWHITLSRFFVNYVYIPLGGSRKGKVRALVNVFIIFLLSGIWHGANWTFVVWGILQGLAVMFDNLYLIGVKGESKKQQPKVGIPKLLGQFITFNYFAFSFVVFRSENLSVALQMFKNIFSFRITGCFNRFLPLMDLPEIYIFKQAINMFKPNMLNGLYALTLLIYFVISILVITRKNTLEIINSDNMKIRNYALVVVLFILSVISFSQVSTFIYFNF